MPSKVQLTLSFLKFLGLFFQLIKPKSNMLAEKVKSLLNLYIPPRSTAKPGFFPLQK